MKEPRPPSDASEQCELRTPFLSPIYSVPIERTRFDTTLRAKNFLLTYMALEESVLQVLYAEQLFEEFLLRGALDFYLFTTHDYQYFQQMRLRANIHVGGVLNAITSFRDQFPKFADHPEANATRKIAQSRWAELKSESVTFVFGERLRNYAQHQNQPVSSATTGGGWDEGRTLLESHLSVFCDVGAVADNRDIEQEERERYLQAFGESADLSLVIREMVGKVGIIVKETRDHLAAAYEAAISQYEDTLSLASPYFDGSKTTDMVRLAEGAQERHRLFEEFTQQAKLLRSNMVMTNNHMHFISNRARGHLATANASRKT